jgi:hypothetical protein
MCVDTCPGATLTQFCDQQLPPFRTSVTHDACVSTGKLHYTLIMIQKTAVNVLVAQLDL